MTLHFKNVVSAFLILTLFYFHHKFMNPTGLINFLLYFFFSSISAFYFLVTKLQARPKFFLPHLLGSCQLTTLRYSVLFLLYRL